MIKLDLALSALMGSKALDQTVCFILMTFIKAVDNHRKTFDL